MRSPKHPDTIDLNSGLAHASKVRGSGNLVLHYLNSGAYPNSLDIDESPSVVIAAGTGDLDRVEYLLRAGADVNWTEHERKKHFSALHHAILIPHKNTKYMLKLLLEYGAYPNMKALFYGTPLHSIVDYPQNESYSEDTAIEIAEILLEYGADLHENGLHGLSLLTKARNLGWNRLANFLERYEYTDKAFRTLEYFHSNI